MRIILLWFEDLHMVITVEKAEYLDGYRLSLTLIQEKVAL
jgi:hypothetical protein